jgi:hypothetical protein
MMNILGIAIKLIGRYGGHIVKLWFFWELDAQVELILSTGEGQQETGSDQLREQ